MTPRVGHEDLGYTLGRLLGGSASIYGTETDNVGTRRAQRIAEGDTVPIEVLRDRRVSH